MPVGGAISGGNPRRYATREPASRSVARLRYWAHQVMNDHGFYRPHLVERSLVRVNGDESNARERSRVIYGDFLVVDCPGLCRELARISAVRAPIMRD